MLLLKNISIKFHKNQILKHLEFKVEKGDCIYIHGKNGSGKSTLLKIICDIIKPEEGIINIKDETYIGALIENPGFVESESIQYNLEFLSSFRNKYNELYILELCSIFSLDFNNKAPIKNYSVGMRQKVGIIQAIMEDQNLILLDEPTRGLDKDGIEVFERIVNSLVSKGKSIVIASHDELKNINYTKKYELCEGILVEE